MVAIVLGEVDHAVMQLPVAPDAEHDGRGVTLVGAWLKIPVGVNCTVPFGKLCASALAGVAVTDSSIRALLLPHPALSAARLITRIEIAGFIESSDTSRLTL
jgi:hypothetical protein